MPSIQNVNDLNSTLKFPQPNAAACCMNERKKKLEFGCVLASVYGGKETLFPHKLSHIQRQTTFIVPQVLFESIFSDILIVNFRFHRSNKNEPEEIGRKKNYQHFVFSFFFSFSLCLFKSFIGKGE